MHGHTEIILKYTHKFTHCPFYNFLLYSDYTSVSWRASTRMYSQTECLCTHVLMYTQQITSYTLSSVLMYSIIHMDVPKVVYSHHVRMYSK